MLPFSIKSLFINAILLQPYIYAYNLVGITIIYTSCVLNASGLFSGNILIYRLYVYRGLSVYG